MATEERCIHELIPSQCAFCLNQKLDEEEDDYKIFDNFRRPLWERKSVKDVKR